ncbi:MAG: hypothetical protein GQ527_09910 [Bacteroidales bacterium]|nr:hypothetical protein [Bacteroidales bacterium]
METKYQEIETFIKEYFRIYFTERNYDKLLPFFSPDISVIGTGLHEIGKNAKDTILLYQKDLQEVKSPIQYSDLDININILTSHFSVVSGKFSLKGESKGIAFTIDPLRYSFTIRKEIGAWKILHLHISTPNDQQMDDELYPLQKLITQNELLNQKVEERTKELSEVNKSLIDSNKTKEKLFSLIAHDIKTPFNSLMGFIDILKTQYDDFDSSQHKKFINIISDSSNKIFNLTDNLLIWSKLQQDMFVCNFQPINLNNIIQASADTCSEMLIGKEIILMNKIPKAIIVLSDEFMLKTIFRNLISNAIKFSNPGGLITISIHNLSPDMKDEKTISVEDTGIGIPQEQINKLFSSEVNLSTDGTNKEKGSGLGLSLCKEFIGLHGTKIWVESDLNKGSKFYFNLKFL